MPREVIEIPTSKLLPYEAAAFLISRLAYPEDSMESDRALFFSALCSWALQKRARFDADWAKRPFPMRPAFLTWSQQKRIYQLGTRLVLRRLICAGLIVLPHIPTTVGLPPRKVAGFYPSVDNMSQMIQIALGWEGDSVSTVKSKLWKPTKPVAHVAAAITNLLIINENKLFEWADEHALCRTNIYLSLFFYPDVLKMLVIDLAEEFRLDLTKISQFRVREHDTIQFVAR